MKRYDVCGLGNAIVDILIEIDEKEFEELGLERGTMRLVEVSEQEMLLEKFQSRDPVLVSGGSVGNSVIALSQLGGGGAYTCCLGDDRYGIHYKSEFDDLGIELDNPLIVDQTTGTCIVLVTPDAERTMRTCLGVSSHLAEKHINEEILAESKWLFIEGYLFANPDGGQAAIQKAIKLAKANDCKVAITFSEAWVIENFGDPVREAVGQADLIFANETEAAAFSGEQDAERSFQALADQIPNVFITAGPDGARISCEGKRLQVDAFPCDPVDLTGAGDMFAGAVLYGLTQGIDPEKAARCACYLASKVIVHMGARLHHGVKESWDECLATHS